MAARAQHHVDVGVADEAGEHGGLVHAGADGSDDAFGAEPFEGRVGLAEGLVLVVVGVVEIDDVHAVEAEAFQARLQGAADAVGAEVPDAAVGGGHGEAVGEVVAARVGRLEKPAGLGGHRVRVAGQLPQDGAQPAFGEAEAVVGAVSKWRTPRRSAARTASRACSSVTGVYRLAIPEVPRASGVTSTPLRPGLRRTGSDGPVGTAGSFMPGCSLS